MTHGGLLQMQINALQSRCYLTRHNHAHYKGKIQCGHFEKIERRHFE